MVSVPEVIANTKFSVLKVITPSKSTRASIISALSVLFAAKHSSQAKSDSGIGSPWTITLSLLFRHLKEKLLVLSTNFLSPLPVLGSPPCAAKA